MAAGELPGADAFEATDAAGAADGLDATHAAPAGDLPDEAQQAALLQAARDAQTRAYAPYSNFHVGAAVLDDRGRIHAGCNVENAAYPQGVCAEAGALSAMVLAGGRRATAVAVVGDGAGLVTPCGGCRQKLREFGAPQLAILVGDRQRLRARFTLQQLLPESFGPEHLNDDRT